MDLAQKIFGTKSSRVIRKIMPTVRKIESYRDEMMALTDDQLREKTREFQRRSIIRCS